ncbi:MAG: TraV family lipoprotein [Fimbriimonadaceae bacterium]|nr:TraV family lipoprotein [Fimbriimonadaceae bacterium]
MIARVLFAACAATTLLAGCTSLSGVGGSSEYSCKAQPGVRCESVSGTYQNALQHNLPGQQPSVGTRPQNLEPGRGGGFIPATLSSALPASMGSAAGVVQPGGTSGIRSPARILRLWFKPWEDADNDLFDQGYIYVQVDGGRWNVDHAQRRIRDGYQPIRPPRIAAAPSPTGTPRQGPKQRDSMNPEDADSGHEDAPERVSGLKQASPFMPQPE